MSGTIASNPYNSGAIFHGTTTPMTYASTPTSTYGHTTRLPFTLSSEVYTYLDGTLWIPVERNLLEDAIVMVRLHDHDIKCKIHNVEFESSGWWTPIGTVGDLLKALNEASCEK
jgi:hypothetical protein